MAGSSHASKPGDDTPRVPWFLRSAARLFFTLLVVLALPLGGFTAAVVFDARRTLESQAVQQNAVAARLGAEVIRAHFEGLMGYSESYARRLGLHEMMRNDDQAGVRRQLHEYVEHNQLIERVFIADRDGVERYDWPADPGVIGKSFAFRDWYLGASRSGKSYVSEIYLRAASPRRYVVSIATPIYGPNAGVLGYLVAQHTITVLAQLLASIKPGEAGRVTIGDQHGHQALEDEWRDWDPTELPENPRIHNMLADQSGSFRSVDPLTGAESFSSFATVPSIGWIVIATQPGATVYAPARALERAIATLSVLCLLGMLALGFVCMNLLRRHHLALLRLQGLKQDLSGMILHDLRNPLASTILSLDLVSARSSGLVEAARADLARASLSARRLMQLTNTLLDVMRMDDGAIELEFARHDLALLARTKVDEFRPLAQAASVHIEAALPALPLEARVDASLFGRVLDNLIANAIKHTPPGGKIDLRLHSSAPDGPIVLEVADTGEGIAADEIGRLFQKYARAHGQRHGRPYDAGLGLVFCRMAIELHSGTITAESELGRGSTFRVVLPRSPERSA